MIRVRNKWDIIVAKGFSLWTCGDCRLAVRNSRPVQQPFVLFGVSSRLNTVKLNFKTFQFRCFGNEPLILSAQMPSRG